MGSAEAGERHVESTLRMCALLDSVRALHEAQSSSGLREALERHVLAIVLELIPADRGAVLLENQGSESVRIDPPLRSRVGRERSAIWECSEQRCLLLAPLLVRNEVAGIIYLENSPPSPPFQEPQLLLLTAITRIASVALENAFQLEWLRSEVVRLERDLHDDNEMAGSSEKLRELREKI